MAIKDYYKFFDDGFRMNSVNNVSKGNIKALRVYKNLLQQKNNNQPTLLLDKLNIDQVNFLKNILHELEELVLVEELLEMKIYYQSNPDPRNKDIKALYAKAVLPRYKHHINRKQLGIHFGTLKNNPEGWTNENMLSAKMELITKAFKMLTGE